MIVLVIPMPFLFFIFELEISWNFIELIKGFPACLFSAMHLFIFGYKNLTGVFFFQKELLKYIFKLFFFGKFRMLSGSQTE